MKLFQLKDVKYDSALKEALRRRREGSIDMEMDGLLSLMLWNVARWAIKDSYVRHIITSEQADDEDFHSTVLTAICCKIDLVDLDKDGKQILCYLHRVGCNKVKDIIRDAGRLKRQHEDVELTETSISTDIYGRIIGQEQ